MPVSELHFVAVTKTWQQIRILYDLLRRRSHVISHERLPSLEEHAEFVRTHPYRAWYIVEDATGALGSFYLTQENTIALNLQERDDSSTVTKILAYVQQKYTPHPAIKSVRNAQFVVNVPITNTHLMKTIEGMGAQAIQISYIIPPR